MFKSETISNARNDQRDRRFDISSLNFGFVSDLELRISDFHSPRHRGFSFTEIMFAVVILGIGFIMVAAIFPVALQQSKSTAEEANGAAIARTATNFSGQVFSDKADPAPLAAPVTNLPPTGISGYTDRPVVAMISNVVPAPGVPSAWDLLRGSMLLVEEPRYAYAMLYRRAGNPADGVDRKDWASYAQIYIFPLAVRNKDVFDARDTQSLTDLSPFSQTNPTANIMPHPVRIAIENDLDDAGGMDIVAFDTSPTASQSYLAANVQAAVEGAYIVIANDNIAAPDTAPQDDRGRMNGRIYRLGVRRVDLDDIAANPTIIPTMPAREIYELVSGSDFNVDIGGDGIFGPNSAAGNKSDDILKVGIPIPPSGGHVGITLRSGTAWADAFVIGKGYAVPFDPALAPPPYDGTAMPISAYTTFVKVK